MKGKFLLAGVAALLVCGVSSGVDFSNRAYECPTNSTIFVSAFQRFASLKNHDGPNTRYNPTAGAVGYIYTTGVWDVGAAISYEHGTRRYDGSDDRYRVRSNTVGLSVFGTRRFTDGWYVDGDAFVGVANYKAKELRVVPYQGTSDRIDRTVFALGFEVGKVFSMGDGFLITPHLGVDYAYTPSESYQWNGGAYRRTISSQNYWEIPLGVSFRKTYNFGAWQVTPKADLTLVTSVGRMDAMNQQPGFAYRTAKGWKVAGIGGDHIGGRFTAGIDAKLNQRTSIGLDYTYEVRSRYNDHRIMAAVGWSF